MRHVYSGAGAVHVWLGEDHDGLGRAAIKAIKALEKRAIRHKPDMKVAKEDLEALIASHHPLPPKCIDWPSVQTFLSAPWFSRIWTIQESWVNDEVLCYHGPRSIAWSSVVEAAHCTCLRYSSRSYLNNEASDNMHKVVLRQAMRSGGLAEMMQYAPHFDASDARDKVYGLLGLFTDMTTTKLQPDYNRSVRDVDIDATRASIELQKHLDVLKLAPSLPSHDGDSEPDDFPSWVPKARWASPGSHTAMASNYPHSLAPGCEEMLNVTDTGVGENLKLRGLIVDAVHREPCPKRVFVSNEGYGWQASIRQIWMEVQAASHMYAPEETVAALADTLTADRPVIFEFLAACFRSMLEGRSNDPIVEHGVSAGMVRIACGSSHDRSFFISKAGRFATGHPSMKRGDQICILFGSDVPLVLRPDRGRWTLIGDAWLHGVMSVCLC